jgi:hypothetical protein
MPYLIIALLVLYVVNEAFNRIERTKLLNRLMAKDYKEFKYYEDKWKGDLKEIEVAREEVHEDRKETKKEAEEEGDADGLY